MESGQDAAPEAEWLIFGLGNPGAHYEATRHNLGYRLVDRLAQRLGCTFRAGRADYFAAVGQLGHRRIHLIKPTTYMNLSGRAIRQYRAIERPGEHRLVVAVDDAALPLGRIRIRPRGSAGGHNGLLSVEEHLGSTDYPRVRMGVGPVPPGCELADFVLQEFAPEDREVVDAMVARAADAVVSLIEEGPERAMRRFNG